MKTKLILLIAILSVVFNSNAQNLKESLGGIKTNFQFFSDTTNLKAIDQIIIQRAEKKSSSDSNFGTGWGYGYQSFHIEFITRKHLTVTKFAYKAGRNNNDKLELTFYDCNNIVLASYSADFSIVDLFNNSLSNDSQIFYSIDLIDIPIVLLDKTVKINLTKEISSKKI
jgi:hypothetical protein